MRFMRFLSLTLIYVLPLSGCTAATSGVATIGLRIQFGDIKKANVEPQKTVVIKESEADFIATAFMCDTCGTTIPYKNAFPIPREAITIGSFSYVEDFDNRKIYVDMGKETDFNIIRRRGKGDYLIERKYRLWYGYPAQLLQVVAAPVDVMLSIGEATLLLLAYPLYR